MCPFRYPGNGKEFMYCPSYQATPRSVSDSNAFYPLLSLNLCFEVNHIFATSVPNSEPPTAAELLGGSTPPPIASLVPGASFVAEDLTAPAGAVVDEITENQNDPAPNIDEPGI